MFSLSHRWSDGNQIRYFLNHNLKATIRVKPSIYDYFDFNFYSKESYVLSTMSDWSLGENVGKNV